MLAPSPRSSDFPPGIHAGDIIANRYRLEEVVGRGGMGVVVAARHLELDERVAVKFMSPDTLLDPEAVARFDREVKAAARIKSEYVSRVYDAGKLPDGQRYMVLEFLEGEDLSARVQRNGPLEPEQAIRFVLQASSAVFEAHALGIVHRDLKPANLRVVRRADGSEIVKVLDFGVMKRMPGPRTDTEALETKPGTIVGTPFYTSPEQLRGSTDVDVRTDVWSLGATLFELLTGCPPFGGKTYPQLIANVLESEPLSLRTLHPDLSEGLEAVVMRCLEKQPTARFPDIISFVTALVETIELDAEQRGLLDRMHRHHRALPLHTPTTLEPPTRSSPFGQPPTPGAQLGEPRVVPNLPAGGLRISTKEYRSARTTTRRLVLTSIAALLTASLVVALGLPWLPDFYASPPISTSPSVAWVVGAPNKTPAPKEHLASPATGSPPAPEPTPSLGTQPQVLSSASSHPPPRRTTRTHASATPPKPADAELPSSPSPEASTRRRNPLLVRPR